MIVPPGSVKTAAGEGSRLRVEQPTTMAVAPRAREMRVPDTVMPGPPASSVWLPMMKAEDGWAVMGVIGIVISAASVAGV